MKLSKTYEPGNYEGKIYKLWEEQGAFTPEHRGSDQSFSIVVPPPNANGNLHMGHGLTLAIEDIAVRYHRMKGEASLLLPGADHAGFETQVVYEKQLAAEGKSRFDFSREELYKRIWDFVAENKGNYQTQFRKLGASVDWNRYVYTLDEKIVKRAYATFKKMWDEKLIYRGERLVNYCTFHRTGFADIEVAYKDAVVPLYYMKYGPFELATTRPETKFGDTAVAVHPEDKRYKKWVGKTVTIEGVNGPFEVRVVADDMVDPNFGTGVVKITPAHSFDDWEVAQRHNLQPVRVINHDGTLNHRTGRFEGMTIEEGRKAVVEAMKEKGLLLKVDENYQTRIGHCYKCGTVIEPMLLDQWFINMKPLAEPAIKALESKQITFYPAVKRTQLVQYLKGLKDWNISRQIAWGIPIPAFQNLDDSDDWIFDERVDQEELKIGNKTYRRDPDVFDTWFSSSSWPYATLDYPNGADFGEFYPLSVMETAADILFPWVSRMIMFGLYNTSQVPFSTVYLHGLIQDEHGQKMSKSKGNVINPMEKVEQYGSDALRMGIISGETAGSNRPYDESKVIGARNFANKLWNIARFIQDIKGEEAAISEPWPNSPADNWILTNLQHLTDRVSVDLDNYRFSEAYDKLYHFVWDDFADWYIESSKATPNTSMLEYVLTAVLKIAHPFAPFLTEAIWQELEWAKGILATQSWPEVPAADKALAKQFDDVKTIVSSCRQLQRAMKLSKPTLLHQEVKFMEDNGALIKQLARLGGIELLEAGREGLSLTQTSRKVWLEVDADVLQQYRGKLEVDHNQVKQLIKSLEKPLDNHSYFKNAPVHVVQQTRRQLSEGRDQAARLEEELRNLK